MKRKIIWLVVSGLMVLSLVLASCAPAAPTTPTAPTVPAVPTEKVVKEVVAPGAEMVKDSLGRMVEKPRYGGVFTWVAPRALRGFDPAFNGAYDIITINQTHESLIELDWTKGSTGTGQWGGETAITPITYKIGMLTESWEIPDEQTLIWHIRKGVRFQLNPDSEASRLVGGREFTAEDMAYSINRNFADVPGSFWFPRYLPAERPVSVTAPDKYTVVVKANPGYMDTVIELTGDRAILIAPEVVKKYGDLRNWKNSVGTGAYMLTDYVVGSSATLVRNPNYWMKDPFHPQNQLPYLDGVKFLWITDPSTRLAALRTGKIETLVGAYILSQEDAESLRATNPEMKFRKVLRHYIPTLGFRVDNPKLPWYDQKVRRALSMAIDREAIKRDYYRGNAEILAAPVAPLPEFMAAYTPLEQMPESVQEIYSYQPEKAKKLLAEAGYPNGFKITVDATTQLSEIDLLSVVAFYWEKIGVDLEIKVREYAVFESMKEGRTIMEAGWTTYSNNLLYRMNYWTPEVPHNYGMFTDPYNFEVRDIVKKNAVRNEAVSLAAWKDFNIFVLDKAWLIYLPSPYQYIAWQPWIKAYSGEALTTGYTNWHSPSRYVWIDQALKKSMGF